jgi:2'-5' RNA ligase
MNAPGDELRLFVGVYPPEGSARAMLRALRKLTIPRYRETRLDQVHMTLLFIGRAPACDLDQITESVARSVSGVRGGELTPKRLFTLPARGRPRLVALETDAPGWLLEVQRRLASRLTKPREGGREGKKYLPHITLCRFTRGGPGCRDIDEAVKIEPFDVEQVRLMRSVLGRDGAEHTEIAAFPLE